MTINSRGSSLIQVIIAAGIMAMVALGVAGMMADQNKEVTALGEKLLAKEFESQLKALFENTDYCNCAFRNKAFDLTQTPPVIRASDQFTSLVNGYSAPSPVCTAAGGSFIPTVGTAIPGSSLRVGAMGLGGLTQVSPGVYKADLQVGFTGSVRSMKPISTSVQFSVDTTTGTPATRPFVQCSAGAGPGGIQLYQCPRQNHCNDGQVVNGAWASYGCLGHISSVNSCTIFWWNGGGRACSNACTPL